MAYEQQWSSTHPGCLLVLVDQSESMDDPFGGASQGEGSSKSEQVAYIINSVLDDYLRLNAAGNTFKERAQFAVIGYSGAGVRSALPPQLKDGEFVTLAQLHNSPLRSEVRTQTRRGPEGQMIESKSTAHIWVEAIAAGQTPMCTALRQATDLTSRWTVAHPESYPPVVINITDGLATDGNVDDAARPLLDVQTRDGKLLLFNCHITKKREPAVEFARNEAEIPATLEARTLFWLSSSIPPSARRAFELTTKRPLEDGTRGYIFNGDALSVRKMLAFGTTSANLPDPR